MVSTATSFLADQPRDGIVVFDLAEAFERLPSLSLRRCNKIRLRVPSGRTRGTRKQDSPPVLAPASKRSDIGEMRTTCDR